MLEPATVARTASPSAPLLPEYRLDVPGKLPAFYLTKRSATKALRYAPAGSMLVKLLDPEPDTRGEPHPERKQFSVLKCAVAPGWCPGKITDLPPSQFKGYDFDETCKMVLHLNRLAIDRDKARWAVLARGTTGQYAVMTQEIPRLHRPSDPHQIHPLCEHRFRSYAEALSQATSINRKLMDHAFSPRAWAVVCMEIPSEYRNSFGNLELPGTEAIQPATEGGEA